MNSLSKLLLLGSVLSLAACSALQSDKVDYKTVSKGPTLEVPPDLTQLTRDTRYAVPTGGSVTASGYQQSTPGTAAGTAVNALADVRIERSGTQRWLVVNRPAEKLWDSVKAFWEENGLTLSINDPQLGIMETEWAENRSKMPQDIVRRTLGRVFDALYDSGERDKFRIRMERLPDGNTEIYLSHRGMIEEYANSDKTSTRWQAAPSNPEREAEYLRRLMIKLGATPAQAQASIGNAAGKPGLSLNRDQGIPVIAMDESFDRAWRRVGLALDRTGFTVEDRDRSQGTFFVRYVEPASQKEAPGFFSKLFSRGSDKQEPSGPRKYRITVKSQGTGSQVGLLTANGEPEVADKAQRILQVILDDLQR